MNPRHVPSLPRTAALAALLVLAACSAPEPGATVPAGAAPAPAPAARPLPALPDALLAWDTRARAALPLDALLDRLAAADVVFLGETHLDDTTHRFELAVLEGLAERRAGRVVLSLEMFERDVQPVLDDYLAGRLDEDAFLAAARPWGNYRTDYRPLVEAAKARGLPVVAANAPAALRRRVAMGGRAALDALPPAERALLPEQVLPAGSAYWERVDRATRGHMDFSSQPDEQRLFSGQSLWDNSMGEACADALAAHPGAAVLHVVGGFHVQYRDGTAAQLRARAPGARVAVVEVLPAPGLHAARPERDAELADFLVYAADLGRSVEGGTHAVSVPAELRYAIDVPAAATEAAPAPLLVWLPDAGERSADARAFLRAALGAEAALAVVEPPFPELAGDLAPGGRWARPSAFRADQARVQHGLERLVEHVTRRLPVSAGRVVLAGRGLGATAVLWSALRSDWLDARFLAVEPRGARALQMEGLPDRAGAAHALRVLVPPGGEPGAAWITADFAEVGTPATLGALEAGEPAPAQVERALREALGLPAPAPPAGEPLLCVLERDLPRARQWAAAFARRLERAGTPARVVAPADLRGDEDPARLRRLRVGGEWPLSSFAEGRGLPLAEGDFGGTTLLVVPAGAGAEEREAWLALERNKALARRSPFSRLRVAVDGGEPSLAQVLGELQAAGARSVLVVPATFCASPEEMQALRAAAGPLADDPDAFDLAWLPGLGAELCAAAGAD